jgi:hypothetical protein
MPTPSVLKTSIDNQITNKTQPYSIDNVDVGNRMKDIVDLTIRLQFNTTSDRISYLTNPNAQPFQEADDKEDGNKYYINSDGTDWVLIASNSPKTEIILFTNQTTLTITWDSTRKAKFGNAASFVVETQDIDGKYRQKTNLEIYPDDISDTTSYHIDLGGGTQSGRVVIK